VTLPVGEKPAQIKMKSGAKRALLKRFNYECLYCSEELTEVSMTVEHLIPRSWGGESNKSNLAAACEPCNCARGDQELHLYIAGLLLMDRVYAKLQYLKILEKVAYEIRSEHRWRTTTRVVKEPTRKYQRFWANLGYGVKK
jgi:hypothetical protein